jgi:hypothetical protein
MKIRFVQSFARDRINSFANGREYEVEDNEARKYIKAGIATTTEKQKGKHVLDTIRHAQ